MFGIIFGTACLVGLVAVLARGRHHRAGFGRRGRHWFLNEAFSRLDTTPGQEKAIRTSLDEFFDEAREARRELISTRAELGQAVRGEVVDQARIQQVFSSHDEQIDRLRKAAMTALGRIHETLDQRQRETLADFVETKTTGIGQGRWAQC